MAVPLAEHGRQDHNGRDLNSDCHTYPKALLGKIRRGLSIRQLLVQRAASLMLEILSLDADRAQKIFKEMIAEHGFENLAAWPAAP